MGPGLQPDVDPAGGAPAPGEVAGLVLAAGRGSRFDGIKQLASFRGRPLIEHAVEAITIALDAPPVVVLGYEAERIAAEADLGGAEIAVCPDRDRGQSASLRTGVEAILARRPGATAAAIVLGDQPLITAAAIRRLASARAHVASARPGEPAPSSTKHTRSAPDLRSDPGARLDRVRTPASPAESSRSLTSAEGAHRAGLLLRATYGGRPGHPVLLERSLFAAAAAQSGDQGLRGLIAECGAEPVECGDLGSDTDIDTPEDLARLE